MADDHFFIDPVKVSALGADFHSTSTGLDPKIKTFGTNAENVNDAFGILAESTAALQKYVAMTQATVTSLQQLSTQLQGYSDALAQTVTAYQKADQAHATQLKVV
ncbi:hypothetical protein P3T37_001056 [Kitasatospora sp. MAA4]|uniref:type VII secretion target n=1 Tax=Kitasatospora sp. MAA4 TaxID=3035093 RepID=UPI00247649E5|nr:type VII secretion target [Kitasatospora sp. MAA4]MDH6131682.1 hypothetical protein [Kitasatospora sp. MAA4]